MKKYIALLLALMMIFALAACGGNQKTEPAAQGSAEAEAAASELAAVQAAGKLVVGITDYKPMDYKENDEWIGFDADMAKAFAASLGVDVEFVEIDWDNKIMELNGGSVDCIWNGMTLTDEVKSSMDCSVPYCVNTQVVIMAADKAGQYADEASLNGLSVAVEAGSAGEAAANNLEGVTVTPVKDQASALMEVASGTSDACVIDLIMAAAMVGEGTDYADLTVAVTLGAENAEEFGVGFRQGSDLVAAFNDFFAAAVKDGTVMKLAEQYGIAGMLSADALTA